jgi:hypothetical protein
VLAPPGQTESAKDSGTLPLNEQVPSAGFTRSRERHGLPNDLSKRLGIVRGRCSLWCA